MYKQLKKLILDDINNGKLKEGDKIMSERMIAEKGNVSRMTARNALSILEREGLVERRVGAGTFIVRKLEMDFITFNSYSRELKLKGLRPSTKVLNIKKDFADLAMARKLNIEVADEIIIFERLRSGNDIPIAIEKSYIPYSYCKGIEEYITDDVSLYKMLETHYGVKPIKADQYMQVAISNEFESKLLKIKDGSACIFLESIAYNADDQVVEVTESTIRSDIVRYYSRLSLEN
ncbi:GntR family transcriptional regulator [Virgibacillus necropolis]|uniref:GntR family transcriptional regulator n=1 Tax=Virgibacillus necropolis TaxID=163877 RepID=UPI00384CDDDF